MDGMITPVCLDCESHSNKILLKAEPENIQIDGFRAAVIVVDMQNAFVSRGGMFDLRGIDITRAQKIIGSIKEILNAVRKLGGNVFYIVTKYPDDLREGGARDSPNWYKGTMSAYRDHPEWRDRMITEGTWGAQIVDGLKPQKRDIVIPKTRYSAFYSTDLETTLSRRRIRFLLFTGVATNVCVEAAIRDAYYRDYFPILISDATANTGPEFIQEASVFNVKRYYGWVTTSEEVLRGVRKMIRNA
jgi:ureidoacrylate peracid hydrolase